MNSAVPGRRRPGPPTPDGREEHKDWLSLIDRAGPFLSLPVLLKIWPNLDPVEPAERERLRSAHSDWLTDQKAGRDAWVDYVLRGLLEWGDELRTDPGELAELRMDVPEFDASVTPDFVLVEPGSRQIAPATTRLLGMLVEPGQHPTKRVAAAQSEAAWAATPVDRMAQLCRRHGVQLGLVTDGRWWALVRAARGGKAQGGIGTTHAVFDAITWPEHADRMAVRALRSLLRRKRFFGVPANEQLPALFDTSLEQGDEVTDQLGVQVRQAVELLVTAMGQKEQREMAIDANEAYRAAVTVMMRIVFLLFVEDQGLLPSDNTLYINSYSVGRLCEQLEERVRENGEEELEHSAAAWHRLLALFFAVYGGVDHPELRMPAYDGSLFDPKTYAWLERLSIDDRTIYHMLLSVQYVTTGTGKLKERRRLTFRDLDVEQIGYVYEGLLSFEGYRAADTVVGLIGRAGQEDEVELTYLERITKPFRHADGTLDVDGLGAKLAADHKDSGIGSGRALARALTTPGNEGARKEATRLLHAACADAELVERMLPFFGLLRRDLRGLPVVVNAGALYVTESSLRKDTGAHYTPRELAEQVVVGALEPLVYSPGPLQTADRDAWRPLSSEKILDLRVADIAMGSAAFLVAACRYLAARLLEAWSREKDPQATLDDAEIRAKRQVIEHCLYGVDINPMAVEMAKLSLWLVSMDPNRPFTFLDDRLVAGDSLLGITKLEQLEAMSLHPDASGAKYHDPTKGMRALANKLIERRNYITALGGDDADQLADKRQALGEVQHLAEKAITYADLLVGAALSAAGKGAKVQARQRQTAQHAISGELDGMRELACEWLATDLPAGATKRVPLHWPLVFPEITARGGFDAIVGNPPFLGGSKLTGSLGTAYREFLVFEIGQAIRGNADLVAYFLLNTHRLLNAAGQAGLIATKTLTEGPTRVVGLDQIAAHGIVFRRGIKSEPWPSRSANLKYCAVWSTMSTPGDKAEKILDGVSVSNITSSLDVDSKTLGIPHQLSENADISFTGSKVHGKGFTMEPQAATALIDSDIRNKEVLFPYINGKELNQNPGAKSIRWIINFHDWPEEKAKNYPECYSQVLRFVKPEREHNHRAVYRDRWWQYAEKRPALLEAVSGLDRVIALTQSSSTQKPIFVSPNQVLDQKLVIFASREAALLALLTSNEHYCWTTKYGSTRTNDLVYTPSNVFQTFPRPVVTEELQAVGEYLNSFRSNLMHSRQAGLTDTYNLVHDKSCQDADIVELRSIHEKIDYEVARAYGWDDLLAQGLDHGFHETRQGPRFTVGPVVRQEILDLLLEENHRRYAAEQATQGDEEGTLF